MANLDSFNWYCQRIFLAAEYTSGRMVFFRSTSNDKYKLCSTKCLLLKGGGQKAGENKKEELRLETKKNLVLF